MKKLITITQLDRIETQVKGAIRVDAFQMIQTLPNGNAAPEHRAQIRATAAMFDRNFNDGHTERNVMPARKDVHISATNRILQGGDALPEQRQRVKAASPDMQIQDEYVLAVGNRAAVEYIMKGTQTRPLTCARLSNKVLEAHHAV